MNGTETGSADGEFDFDFMSSGLSSELMDKKK